MATQVFDHVTAQSVSAGGSQTCRVRGKTVVVTCGTYAKMIIQPVGLGPEDRLVVFLHDNDHFKYEGDEVRDFEVTMTNREVIQSQDMYVTAY